MPVNNQDHLQFTVTSSQQTFFKVKQHNFRIQFNIHNIHNSIYQLKNVKSTGGGTKSEKKSRNNR